MDEINKIDGITQKGKKVISLPKGEYRVRINGHDFIGAYHISAYK